MSIWEKLFAKKVTSKKERPSISWSYTEQASDGTNISCVGYDELFNAANRRSATPQEKRAFDQASQDEKNRMVREWVDRTQGQYTRKDVVGRGGQVFTAFWRSPSYNQKLRRIGSLPGTLQGIALELQIGQEASVDNTGKLHRSGEHGYHGDLYLMKRITEVEVELTKLHTDEL